MSTPFACLLRGSLGRTWKVGIMWTKTFFTVACHLSIWFTTEESHRDPHFITRAILTRWREHMSGMMHQVTCAGWNAVGKEAMTWCPLCGYVTLGAFPNCTLQQRPPPPPPRPPPPPKKPEKHSPFSSEASFKMSNFQTEFLLHKQITCLTRFFVVDGDFPKVVKIQSSS